MEGYYLDQVARGLDDYYTGRGEADGIWIGNATDTLGLAGQVAADDLRDLLAGRHPGTTRPSTVPIPAPDGSPGSI